MPVKLIPVLLALASAGLVAAAPAAPGAVTFTDVTAAAGIKFTTTAAGRARSSSRRRSGRGAAFLDADGDGWLDMLLSTAETGSRRRQRSLHALYRNNRNGTFTDVTAGSGLDVEMYGMGVAAGDYDNDGRRGPVRDRARGRPAVPQ